MMIDRVNGKPSSRGIPISLREASRQLVAASPEELAEFGTDARRAVAHSRSVLAADAKAKAVKARKKRSKLSRKANRGR